MSCTACFILRTYQQPHQHFIFNTIDQLQDLVPEGASYEFADDEDEPTLCCPLPALIPIDHLPETEEDVHVGDVIEGIEYVAGYIGIY